MVAACLSPASLFFALAPEIRSRYSTHWQGAEGSAWRFATVKSGAAQLAFHMTWASPSLGVVYFQFFYVYEDRDEPSWALGVYEHCMSFFQIISCGVVLTSVIREGESQDLAPVLGDIGAGLLAELQRQSDTP